VGESKQVSCTKAYITNDKKRFSIEFNGVSLRKENVANVRKEDDILQFRRDLFSPNNKQTLNLLEIVIIRRFLFKVVRSQSCRPAILRFLC
jgi:hypothetical protein